MCLDSGDDFDKVVLEGVCGSGRDEDCDGNTHAISCCTGSFRDGSGEELFSVGSCTWAFGDFGQVLTCLSDTRAIVGRCGSGRDPDCYGQDYYHGILCCDVYRL